MAAVQSKPTRFRRLRVARAPRGCGRAASRSRVLDPVCGELGGAIRVSRRLRRTRTTLRRSPRGRRVGDGLQRASWCPRRPQATRRGGASSARSGRPLGAPSSDTTANRRHSHRRTTVRATQADLRGCRRAAGGDRSRQCPTAATSWLSESRVVARPSREWRCVRAVRHPNHYLRRRGIVRRSAAEHPVPRRRRTCTTSHLDGCTTTSGRI